MDGRQYVMVEAAEKVQALKGVQGCVVSRVEASVDNAVAYIKCTGNTHGIAAAKVIDQRITFERNLMLKDIT